MDLVIGVSGLPCQNEMQLCIVILEYNEYLFHKCLPQFMGTLEVMVDLKKKLFVNYFQTCLMLPPLSRSSSGPLLHHGDRHMATTTMGVHSVTWC